MEGMKSVTRFADTFGRHERPGYWCVAGSAIQNPPTEALD